MDKKHITYLINGVEYIFTFPTAMIHREMDKDIRLKLWDEGINPRRIGAGFVTKSNICYGASESMNLSSRGTEDSNLINSRYHKELKKNDTDIELPIALNEYIIYKKEAHDEQN